MESQDVPNIKISEPQENESVQKTPEKDTLGNIKQSSNQSPPEEDSKLLGKKYGNKTINTDIETKNSIENYVLYVGMEGIYYYVIIVLVHFI